MIKVVGVRFRTAGKIYFFDPLNFDIKKGDNVIVETARGIEFGTVVGEMREVEDDKVVQPLKPVIRIANDRDREQEESNRLKEKEAFRICLEKIRKHELEMKLIDAEYTFDNNKVLFYFTADGRIDFRELVKDLASVFKTRIELRQIGVRDETKTVGGIGICGRVLCCHSYLSDFIPVSIKMAKEQNLSLNPTKISGVCGRLMCCLKHEEETYEELNRKLPGVGDYVTTEDGLKGEVQSVNVLRQLVKVIVEVNDEKEIREYEPDKLRFKKRHGKKDKSDVSNEEMSREELKELELLEKQEKIDNKDEKPERRDRAERGDRPERNERAERKDRAERGERPERSDREERSDRPERNERFEKGERGNRPENGERSERSSRYNRSERNDRYNRGERSENGERADRGSRPERSDRVERGDRPEQGERADRSSRPENGEHREGSDRAEREHRYDRNRRSDNRAREGKFEKQEGKPRRNDNQTERK